jgi:hypothetical protein
VFEMLPFQFSDCCKRIRAKKPGMRCPHSDKARIEAALSLRRPEHQFGPRHQRMRQGAGSGQATQLFVRGEGERAWVRPVIMNGAYPNLCWLFMGHHSSIPH